MSWKESALEKLAAEKGTGKYDRYAQVMKDRVCETLADFCRQDAEFAQAVVQGGTRTESLFYRSGRRRREAREQRYFKTGAVAIAIAECIRWMALPPEEEVP